MNDMFLPTGCAISGVNPTFISFDANGNLLILRRKALLNSSMTKINNLQYTYSYRGLASAAHSTYHYAIGNSINLSQVSSTSTGGYVISGSYYRTASGAPTTVNGTSGNFAAYYVGGDGSENVRKRTGIDKGNWDSFNNYMTGIGMAIDGGAYRLGKILDKRLAYEFSKPYHQAWKTPISHTSFKTPIGSVNVNTGLIKNVARGFKVGGAVFGVVGVGMTTAEIITGQKSFVDEGGLDLIMGGVAFIPGGGWIVSGVYFGGKYLLESTENDFWNK